MAREIRIPHSKIKDPKKITREFEERFKAEGLNLHVHEVEKMDDDFKRGERILKVKTTKYFFT
jgi:hypothetical protein